MNLKPLRDVLVQVLATVMIPLTVAGVGWYYTIRTRGEGS